MKTINLQSLICLIILFLFAGQAWAEEWVLYSRCDEGEIYYDKSSVKKVNKNIINVRTKTILNEKGRTKAFSILKKLNIAPCNSGKVGYEITLEQYDCERGKYKNFSTTIYSGENNILVSQNVVGNKWSVIRSDSIVEKLKKIVCNADRSSSIEKK